MSTSSIEPSSYASGALKISFLVRGRIVAFLNQVEATTMTIFVAGSIVRTRAEGAAWEVKNQRSWGPQVRRLSGRARRWAGNRVYEGGGVRCNSWVVFAPWKVDDFSTIVSAEALKRPLEDLTSAVS
ncbi:uncharacterized protein LOC135586183 [Musa acuminata AAA Group]|uniref:uncharacterized protein LOC135586183 n=1 Tax=Musa acuminata AAA Group TaxID=214697 RepID=UPI0031E2322A